MPPAEKKQPTKSAKLTTFFKSAGEPYKKTETRKPDSLQEPEADLVDLKNLKKVVPKNPEDVNSLEYKTMGTDWYNLLSDQFNTSYFKKIKEFLKEEEAKKAVVFPAPENIYSWSRYTPFSEVRVVILGQDPYHNYNQAHGLAFSVLPGNACPPSLINIYKTIHNDYPDKFPLPIPKNGYLEKWAKNGVLLLNTTLTVRAHNANSHSTIGWDIFTSHIIKLISSKKKNVVFLLWGAHAQKKAIPLIDKKKHLVLTSVHPSPLSASRAYDSYTDDGNYFSDDIYSDHSA
ncbi:hypothetical protein BB560_003406, partial [Smittium megazygosporum]